jgi:hypothetical protein
MNPSATAFVSWNVKSVVKLWTLTRLEYHAEPFSERPPFVSCSFAPSSVALPLKENSYLYVPATPR